MRKNSSHVSPRMCFVVGEVDAEDVNAVEGQGGVEEGRDSVGHRGDDPDQTDDVEPAGHPAPALAAEVVRPPVGPAGGRIPRGQLGHREGHHQHERAQHRPPDRRRDRPAVLPRERERRKRPRENRDDRERDREIRETRPRARKLLPVAELLQPPLVFADRGRGTGRLAAVFGRHRHPLRSSPTLGSPTTRPTPGARRP